MRQIVPLTRLQKFSTSFSKANFCLNWVPKFCGQVLVRPGFCFNWAVKIYGQVLVRPVFAYTGLQNFTGKFW